AHPPLYYYLLHLWILLVGRSEFAVRYLSLIFGTLLVPLVHRFGARLMGGRTALVAASMAALAPVQVYYSQETRMYALATFLALLGFYLFVRLLEEGASRRIWAAYVFVTALSLYVHYYSFLLLAAENLLFLFTLLHKKEKRSFVASWLLSQFFLALLFLPWAKAPLGRMASGYLKLRSQVFGASPLPPLDFLRQVMMGLTLGPTLSTQGLYPWLTLALFVLLFFFGALRRRPHRCLILTCFLVPTFLAYLADLYSPHFRPRYLLIVAPAYYMILAQVLEVPAGRFRIPSLLGISLVLILFAYGLFNNYFNPAYARDDYRSLYAHIMENSHPGEAIVLDAPWQGGTFHYYYRGQLTRYSLPREYPPGEKTMGDLQALAKEHTGVWLVLYGNASVDPEGLVEGWLGENGYLASSDWFGGVRLSHYLLPLPSDLTEDIPNPQAITFGGSLAFLGYRLEPEELTSGQPLHLTLYWKAIEEMANDYHLSFYLLDEKEESWAQRDFAPLEGAHPTSDWAEGEVVRDQYRLPIPPGVTPGRYDLTLTVYSRGNLLPLPVYSDGSPMPEGRVRLATVEIAPLFEPPSLPAPPIEKAVRADFVHCVALLGYGTEGERPRSGEEVRLYLLWQAKEGCQEATLVIQLIDSQGKVWKENRVPGLSTHYPLLSWREGEVVQGRYSLLLPANIPAGEARMRIGLQTAEGPLSHFGGWLPWGREWLEVARVQVEEREHIFSIPTVEIPLKIRLGSVAFLLGYDLEGLPGPDQPLTLAPRERLKLTLYWQAAGLTESSYTVFVHLIDGRNQIWGQRDALPQGGARPTTSWIEGETIIDNYEVVVSEDMPPGEYRIEVGMYDAVDGKRLPAVGEGGESLGDRILLDTPIIVRLQPPSATPTLASTSTATATATVTPTPTPEVTEEDRWLARPIGSQGEQHVDRFYPYGSTGGGRYRIHHGVEFQNEEGMLVLAAASGRVVVAGRDDEVIYGAKPNFYGQLVIVELEKRYWEEKLYNLYAHLSQIDVEVGQVVEEGDTVGRVGMSGSAFGPHLHFEVRVGGNAYDRTLNPELWLRPLPGCGSIVGRLIDAQGRPIPETLITVHHAESPQQRWQEISTYPLEEVNPDQEWGENFVLGDVPEGTYILKTRVGGKLYQREVVVVAGEIVLAIMETE
ncbi:MAG: peptidoglycan DD-metalloendopeptidase family protein, partial [Anaerolineae bacterium]